MWIELCLPPDDAGEIAWALMRQRCSKERCPALFSELDFFDKSKPHCKFYEVCDVCIDTETKNVYEGYRDDLLYRRARTQCRNYVRKHPEQALDEMGYINPCVGG